jgi:hypothetical protein
MWGEKKFSGGSSVLTGSGGEGGGGVDAAWRWSGREREALAWCGAARRDGIGAAVARPRRARAARCRARVENGGVGATRVDVADRWAGTLRGPGCLWVGAAWGSTVRRSVQR